MSSRKVRLVLICEDQQHDIFVRRFLIKSGWKNHQIRIQINPVLAMSFINGSLAPEAVPRPLGARQLRGAGVQGTFAPPRRAGLAYPALRGSF